MEALTEQELKQIVYMDTFPRVAEEVVKEAIKKANPAYWTTAQIKMHMDAVMDAVQLPKTTI